MQYYRLVYSNNNDDGLYQGERPILINSYDLDGLDLRSLWKGISIKNWNEKNIVLHYSEGEVMLDYIPNNLSWLIFSDKAVGIIQTLLTEMEIFPVSISSKISKNEIQAKVVNILSSIFAMNWEKSDYVSWDDNLRDIKVIRNLVINRSAIINNIDIFRLAENKNFIIVSERFKREIEKNGLIGFGFWKIDLV